MYFNLNLSKYKKLKIILQVLAQKNVISTEAAAKTELANATRAGQALTVLLQFATTNAQITANAKAENANASINGRESTAQRSLAHSIAAI